MTFTLPAAPTAPQPNYAVAVVLIGERVWGPHWPSGMAHLIGGSSKTLQRLHDAARAGRDYRAAPAILAQVAAHLGDVATALKPWAPTTTTSKEST